MVDKPAAVAKAPFGVGKRCGSVTGCQNTTKRDLLTLAKDSMAGIISGIVVLARETPSRGQLDGGRSR